MFVSVAHRDLNSQCHSSLPELYVCQNCGRPCDELQHQPALWVSDLSSSSELLPSPAEFLQDR